jgi:uncharacterized DUF497 family protein
LGRRGRCQEGKAKGCNNGSVHHFSICIGGTVSGCLPSAEGDQHGASSRLFPLLLINSIYMADLEFEWDDAKNSANIVKHGLEFAIACNVFKDVFAIERLDDRQDYGEERYVTIGMVDGRLLSVAYTMRSDDVVRIISARGATPLEKRQYHEENS